MPTPRIDLPSTLEHLATSDTLEQVPLSELARKGTQVLRRALETAQGLAVSVQGQRALVTLSRQQYDDMVLVIRQLQDESPESEFNAHLRVRFDTLVASMSPTPGALKKATRGLMRDTEGLREHYRPGDTETRE